jgi:hypothetical protein
VFVCVRPCLLTHLPAHILQLLPTKPLVPRTFRLPAGNTILMGGLARIDVIDHPGGTIYLTVWASTYINLHMGGSGGNLLIVFGSL